MNKKPSFEASLTRLQEIVVALEKGDVPLADSLKLFEEGAGLSSFCYDSLKNAEQKISEISTRLTEDKKEDE